MGSTDLEKEMTAGVEMDEITLEEPKIPRWRLISVVVSLAMGLFLSLMDSTIVATALVNIGRDFNALSSVTWVALSYTLAYVGFAVLFCRISDVIGRRNAYSLSYFIFIAFSFGCGFATTLNQLIVFRAFQGLGGAGLYSLTFVILPEVMPPSKQMFIGALAGMVVAVAGVMGPVIGGLITHYTTWRWIFWINAPIGGPPAILLYLAWPKDTHMRQVTRRSIKDVDFLGCILLLAASILVVFAFQEGGLGKTGKVWQSGIFIGPLVAGCLCWLLLIAWEVTLPRFSSISPLLPIDLLQGRVFLCTALCTVTTGFLYFVTIYTVPTHIQIVNQRSTLMAGVDLLPLLVSAAVGSFLGGGLNGKKNNSYPMLIVGSCCMAIGCGFLSTVTSLELEPKLFGLQVLVGAGFGLTVANVTQNAILESGREDQAVAQGVIAQARVLGGSIGIAAYTAILGAIEREKFTNPPQVSEDLIIRYSYAKAFSRTMWICAIMGCLTLLLCLGTFKRNAITLAERAKQFAMEDMAKKRASET